MLLRKKLAAVLGVAGLALTATFAAAGSASAAPPADNGDVKIHDSSTDPKDQRHDPKVCEFFVVGFNFDPGDQITWWIQEGPSFGKAAPPGELSGTLSADDEGYATTTQLTLEPGKYKLWWTFVGEEGKAKFKRFDVECPPPSPSPPPPLPNPGAAITEVCESDDGIGVLLTLTNEGGEADASFDVTVNDEPFDTVGVAADATEQVFIELPNGEDYLIVVEETTTQTGWQFTGTLECEEETESPPPSTTPPGEESTPPGGTTPPGGELPKTGAGFPVGTAALLAVFLLAAGGALLVSRGVIQVPYRRRH